MLDKLDTWTKGWIEKRIITSPPFTMLISINDVVTDDVHLLDMEKIIVDNYGYKSIVVVYDDHVMVDFFGIFAEDEKYSPLMYYIRGYAISRDFAKSRGVNLAKSSAHSIWCNTLIDAIRVVRTMTQYYAIDDHPSSINEWERGVPRRSTDDREAKFTYEEASRLLYMAINDIVPNGRYSDDECSLWSMYKRILRNTKVGMIKD